MGDVPEELDVHYNASTDDNEGSNDQHGSDVQLTIRSGETDSTINVTDSAQNEIPVDPVSIC